MRDFISVYKLFNRRLDDIGLFLQKIASKNDVWNSFRLFPLSKEQKELLDYIHSDRVYTIHYNAVIISLYGCFENYIDSVFSHYLDFVFSKVSSYEELPSSITIKYKAKLGEYLSAQNRFTNIETPLPNIIASYLKILNSDFSTFDKSFLLMHPGNLKVDKICNFMSEMGIESPQQKIYQDEALKTFFIDTCGYDEADYELKSKRKSLDLVSYLERLVDQRNCIAHGWVEDNRISMNDIQSYYIPFLKVFADIILRILICKAIEGVDNSNAQLFCDSPIAVYHNKVVCIHIYNQKISRGDYIIYSTKKGIKCAKIMRIEIDNKPYENVLKDDIDVGLEIDNRIKFEDKIVMFIPFDN